MKNVLVGTAGHIDHGKSALVEALTGTHPDRLEEEKRRGITIDLGFAFLKTADLNLAFIDVPGHERFVRNMLAGAGGIDLVVLVIAADESIKPQTREHFEICRLLGIPRGLIALTKADLVDQDTLELVRMEIEEFVHGSFLDGAPIQPVSARTGKGVDELKALLFSVAADVPERTSSGYLRLPVDRAFAMRGFGTVVTGTLVSGMVKTGDELELLPAGRQVRVRGIQSAGETLVQATAGKRTALNLAGIAWDEVGRGMTLVSPSRFSPTRQLHARIYLLDSAKPLKGQVSVHFHQGTAETLGDLFPIESDTIQPGGTGYAQIRLRDPLLLLPGDRFILRQLSPMVTMGGGAVLDNAARRRRPRDGSILPFLHAFESGNHEAILESLLNAEPHGLSAKTAVARTGWLEQEVQSIAERLDDTGRLRIVTRDPWIMAPPSVVVACAERILAILEEFHQANPLVEGMSRETLRERAAPRVRPEIFRACLDDLIRGERVAVAGDRIMRAGRKIVFTSEEQQASREIEIVFERAGLSVPHVAELLPRLPVDPKRADEILRLLIARGVLVKIGGDLLLHVRSLEKLREDMADYKRRKGDRISVSEFKELTGLSRKYAIPLLEHLDRERVTRRVGEERVIL